MTDRLYTLHHCPRTRSSGILRLAEEIGAPYELKLVRLGRGEHKTPEYLALNPMGKVPMIRHGETIVTEQGAIALYLGDLFPETGLAPQPGDRLRGEMLKWLFFYGNCIEPACLQKAMKWPDPPASTAAYGSYDATVGTVIAHLGKGPWFLGERFSIVDGLWGPALTWLTMFGLFPKEPVVEAYLARFADRPAAARTAAIEARLIAEIEAQ